MQCILCALQFLKYVCGKIHKYVTHVSKSDLRKLPVKKFNKGFIASALLYSFMHRLLSQLNELIV